MLKRIVINTVNRCDEKTGFDAVRAILKEEIIKEGLEKDFDYYWYKLHDEVFYELAQRYN